ncbi:MAG: hypothetical protein HZB83_00085, partial [Deltaproteobacteria bacterium]|nr:hypothetical protein [Deltaproteobacteria bacterium]
PLFARQVGRNCTYCHTIIPKLNETGRIYKSNGYRFEAEKEWKDVKDMTVLPVSFEAEVEGAYDKKTASGVKSEASEMKVEELEISGGGALDKTGRVSALVSIAVSQGETAYETSIKNAFIQINDLAGSHGRGNLNLKAGQAPVILPFLGDNQRFISNLYFAESKLGALKSGVRLVELNGLYAAEEESSLPTHRYSIGVAREDVNSAKKLKGYYATYSAAFSERYSLGLIYRHGSEKSALVDISYSRYGLAAEAEAGPALLTAGYFKAKRDGLPDTDNYMAEVLYMPAQRVSLGGRYDIVREKGASGAKLLSLMARYAVLTNVYAQLELRGLTDESHIAGYDEDKTSIRLFLVALF